MQLKSASSALIRTALFVRNRQIAKQFYAALGLCDIYYEGVLDHPSASKVLGYRQLAPYPVTILKVPGPNFGMLGLFELPVEQESVLPRTGPAVTGETAQVFYVQDIDQTLTVLRAAGALWSPEPVTFEIGHLVHREVCLRDADGFLVNLIERSPETQLLNNPELPFTPLDSIIST